MREKYIDEKVGIWIIFGQHRDGMVDVWDGERDVFPHIDRETAKRITQAQQEFREKLYEIMGARPVTHATTQCHDRGVADD